MLKRITIRSFGQQQVFVWGGNHNNLAFELRRTRDADFPQKLPYDFLAEPRKIVSGYSETLFWTNQDVFVSGVRHVFNKNQLTPSPLAAVGGRRLLDADLDKTHALFLTADGMVHQSAKGGEALQQVELPGPADQIAAGKNVSLAVLSGPAGQQVFIWGASSFGERAIFLDPRVNQAAKPQPLTALNRLLRKEGSRIKKLRLVDTSAVALLDNGQLVSWGNNCNGNLGVPRNELSLVDDFVYEPAFPLRLAGVAAKAIDFELSDNVLVVRLEDGRAAFAGMNGTLTLKVLSFVEELGVVRVGCCHNRYFLISNDGRVFSNKNFEAEELVKFYGDLGLYELDGKYFDGLTLDSIRGKYDNFVAIAK